jgi:hypothetical protein
MDFRCSNSVAALTVLMGSGVCFFFTPAACAGDRIDFSAPAIPMSIPQPEVETKDPVKMIGSGASSGGFMNGVEMAAPAQYYFVKPKTRDKNDWSLNPRLDSDPNQLDADDWSTSRPDPDRSTNNNNLNPKQGANPSTSSSLLQQRNESGLEGGQNTSRFGTQDGWDGDNARFGAQNGMDRSRFGSKNGQDRAYSQFGSKYNMDRDNSRFDSKYGTDRDHSRFDSQNGLDKDNARAGDSLGKGFSSIGENSFWTKAFGHDASGTDGLSAMRLMPSMADSKDFNASSFQERMNNPELGPDSAHPAPLSPDWAGFTSPDNGQGRLTGDQLGEGQASLRAWEPFAASPSLPTRSFSNPEQFNASRVVAPNRPAILTMPQRPGDPH